MDMDKIFESMESLGLNSKKLKKYKIIAEYCALITATSNASEKTLIEKGGAVLAKNDDLISCIKFIQEKLVECYEKGAKIIDFLKNN